MKEDPDARKLLTARKCLAVDCAQFAEALARTRPPRHSGRGVARRRAGPRRIVQRLWRARHRGRVPRFRPRPHRAGISPICKRLAKSKPRCSGNFARKNRQPLRAACGGSWRRWALQQPCFCPGSLVPSAPDRHAGKGAFRHRVRRRSRVSASALPEAPSSTLPANFECSAEIRSSAASSAEKTSANDSRRRWNTPRPTCRCHTPMIPRASKVARSFAWCCRAPL